MNCVVSSYSYLIRVFMCYSLKHFQCSGIYVCVCLIDRTMAESLESQCCFEPLGFLKRCQCDTWYVDFRKGMWSITCCESGAGCKVEWEERKGKSLSLPMKIRKMLVLIAVNKWLSPPIHQFRFADFPVSFLDYVDRSIQYMALFISVTVCSIILGIILVFCYFR